MAHPNEDVVREGFAAFGRADADTLRRLIAPDAIWHASGRSKLSGTYKGIDEILAFFGQTATMTGGTFAIDLHDVVGNDEHVFAAYRYSAQRDDRSIKDTAILLFHVRDGRITEAWGLVGDQYQSDAFFS